jgi:hypothetical protein
LKDKFKAFKPFLRGSFWKAAYDILDENHQTILKMEGPCCICDG